MTPKELQFLHGMIELVAEQSYKLGYEDAQAGKPLKTEGFSMSKASKLTLKSNMEKLTKRR